MRWLALAACAAPVAQPLSAHVVAPPPCPADLAARLEVHSVDACVLGRFPQPGWVVFASTSGARTGLLDVRALLWADGTIVSRRSREQPWDVTRTARAIDLDGDGTDEVVEDLTWFDALGPASGEHVTIYRVDGDTIDAAVVAPVWTRFDYLGAPAGCHGSLAISGTHIAIDVTAVAGGGDELGDCLVPGHHVVGLEGVH